MQKQRVLELLMLLAKTNIVVTNDFQLKVRNNVLELEAQGELVSADRSRVVRMELGVKTKPAIGTGIVLQCRIRSAPVTSKRYTRLVSENKARILEDYTELVREVLTFTASKGYKPVVKNNLQGYLVFQMADFAVRNGSSFEAEHEEGLRNFTKVILTKRHVKREILLDYVTNTIFDRDNNVLGNISEKTISFLISEM